MSEKSPPRTILQNWVTFEIDHFQHFFALQPQLVLWYIHNQSKPLPIITMPEHLIIRIFEPRIICLGVICLILILRVS